MEAVNFKTLDEGKRIAASKKRFVWTFKLGGQEYSLSLTVSYKSKKFLVLLNDDITLFRAKRTHDKEPFRYDFFLDNETLSVVEKDKRADLLFRGRTFHSYLPHSVIHLTQAPVPRNPTITIMPSKVHSRSPSPLPPPRSPLERPEHFATVRTNKATEQLLSPDAFSRTHSALDSPAVLSGAVSSRSIRHIRVTGRCVLEGRADVFLENDFPIPSDHSDLIIKIVHERLF